MGMGIRRHIIFRYNVQHHYAMRKKLFTIKIVIAGEQVIAGTTISRTRSGAKRKVLARLELRHPNIKLNQLI